MRFHIGGRLHRHGVLLGTGELRLELLGDSLRNIALDLENVSEISVERIRP